MCGISHGLLYYAPRPKGYSDSALLRPLMTKSQYRSIKRTVTAILSRLAPADQPRISLARIAKKRQISDQGNFA
jgi:hypothetical protein